MVLKNVFKALDDALDNKQLLIDYYRRESERLAKEVKDLTAQLEEARKNGKENN